MFKEKKKDKIVMEGIIDDAVKKADKTFNEFIKIKEGDKI